MPSEALQRNLRATLTGVAVNLVLGAGKLAAGIYGHSDALIADAIESFADLLGALIVWRGITVAAKPADADHPYGHGKAEPLAAGVELAACAVIREGLANAVRHAHGAPARVLLEHTPGRLGIEVRNGPGHKLAGSGGTGHGLQGMRERVQLWGGSMEAAPSDDGGYRLRVDLPTGGKQ